MKANLGAAIIISCFVNTALAQGIPVTEQVESVASHLVGVMDTTAQAKKNPNAPSVRMTTCKITIKESPNSVYLYQEQALTNKLNQPYRQRFLEIKPSADNQRIESKSFKPAQGENFIGLCDKPESERILELENIGESVCSVFLKPVENGYIGETQKGGCPANVRGAVRITNTIILHSQGMDTWDRGYDAQGNQIWGAQDQSYQYRWLNQNQK